MKEEISDDILNVFIARELSPLVSYHSFRESVQLTYHSCSIEGVELTLLQIAELIAEQILKDQD